MLWMRCHIFQREAKSFSLARILRIDKGEMQPVSYGRSKYAPDGGSVNDGELHDA